MTLTDADQVFEKYRMRGDILPAERFTSTEFMELEFDRLWSRAWQIVCAEDEIPNVGDYVEYSVGPYSVVVVRNGPDDISAVSNACMHRGRELKEQRSRGSIVEFRCPYHGWRYNLDGSIKEVHDPQGFEPEVIDPTCLQLPKAHVGTMGGMVWVSFASEPEPLVESPDEWRYATEASLERYHASQMTTVRHRQTIMQCNWQLGFDTFIDAYHVPGSHPQIILTIPGGTYPVPPREQMMLRYDLFEAGLTGFDPRLLDPAEIEALPDDIDFGVWLAPKAREVYEKLGLDVDFSQFTDRELIAFNSWIRFPNIAGGFSPVSCSYYTVRPNGNDPTTCLLDWWNRELLPEEERSKRERVKLEFYPDFYSHDQWSRIFMQDLGNVQKLQRGMANRLFRDVRFGREAEVPTVDLMQKIDAYLAG